MILFILPIHYNMDFLSKKHPHYLDNRIAFHEPSHTYTIDGENGYLSVTSWVKQHFKPFDADKIIDSMMSGHKWSSSKYFGMTREEIKRSWELNRNTAAAAGTELHSDIEKFYNGVLHENESFEYKQFSNFVKDNPFEPYRTEWTVFDKELKIAGSIDMTFVGKNGELMIYDWKRSKGIVRNSFFETYSTTDCINHIPDTNFWHYSLQLNMYKTILERNYDKKISKLCLVCIHPDQKDYKLYDVPELDYELSELIAIRKSQLEEA